MYKSFTAEDFLEHLELGINYSISGFLVFGGYKESLYGVVEDIIKEIDPSVEYRRLSDEFLNPILEFKLNGKRYWFTKAYGGALLSEYVHLASIFGSKVNIVTGSCGGLYPEANMHDLIIPTFSSGNESTTRAYDSNPENKHFATDSLRKELMEYFSNYKVWEGPTITYQAMLAETREDIESWSKQGYYGVEMEASTVMAVSNYFKVPTAAILRIGDNLIKNQTVLDPYYLEQKHNRKEVTKDILKAAIQVMIQRG